MEHTESQSLKKRPTTVRRGGQSNIAVFSILKSNMLFRPRLLDYLDKKNDRSKSKSQIQDDPQRSTKLALRQTVNPAIFKHKLDTIAEYREPLLKMRPTLGLSTSNSAKEMRMTAKNVFPTNKNSAKKSLLLASPVYSQVSGSHTSFTEEDNSKKPLLSEKDSKILIKQKYFKPPDLDLEYFESLPRVHNSILKISGFLNNLNEVNRDSKNFTSMATPMSPLPSDRHNSLKREIVFKENIMPTINENLFRKSTLLHKHSQFDSKSSRVSKPNVFDPIKIVRSPKMSEKRFITEGNFPPSPRMLLESRNAPLLYKSYTQRIMVYQTGAPTPTGTLANKTVDKIVEKAIFKDLMEKKLKNDFTSGSKAEGYYKL